MGLMSLCRGEAPVVRPSVCPSFVCRPSNISKCFFFAISYPILILFALYGSTRWGIQNFYTEFWNSLLMLIYAHFSKKSQKMLLLPHLLTDFDFFFVPSERLSWGSLNFFTELWNFVYKINYANLCNIYSEITKIASSSFIDRFFFFFIWKTFTRFIELLLGFFKCCLENYLCEFQKITKMPSFSSFNDWFWFFGSIWKTFVRFIKLLLRILKILSRN